MARLFLSFNYADYQSATIVNTACKFKRVASTIFLDEAIWNGAHKKGEAGIRELIDTAVSRSDVTAFLIGRTTFSNKWCQYALRQCIERKKGVFGIYLPNQMSPRRSDWLTGKGFPVHEWESNNLKYWIISSVQKSLTKAS